MASAILDDATYLDVAGVHWEILNGPLDSLDGNGLTTAAIVYENSPAQIQATYMGGLGMLDVTVVNVNDDDFGIYAGDNLDDDWQVFYYGEDNPDAFPGADSDNDGQNTDYEFNVGTNPTDPMSLFRLAVDRVVDEPGQKAIVFSPRFSDRTYTVEKRANLVDIPFSVLTNTTIGDNGEVRTVIDLNATDPEKHYRVKIEFDVDGCGALPMGHGHCFHATIIQGNQP